ncbi:MAG: TonB-dependent receptor [Opitutales bacterium]
MKNNTTPAAALSTSVRYLKKTALLGLALVGSLSAEDREDLPVYELKEIIVTGELWESELQRTTASISVLDEAALENNGTQHFEDVINSIPNLTWTGGSSRPRYIQIRGIGENSQFEGETPDSSVRFLMDDFDLTGVGTVGNLFDVQQVEVLRGPHAGAFGANAAGGVVKLVSNAPTPYWTGQAEVGIGNDNLREMGVAVGGPILESDPEQLTFRFSINSLQQDGFRENQFFSDDDTNERDELTSRLLVRWLPSELWSFEGAMLYANADNGYDEFTLTNERIDTFSDYRGRDEQETLGFSLRGTYHGFDVFDITAVSAYTNTDSFYSYDGDWTNPGRPLFTYSGFLELERDREVWNEELRFDSTEVEDAWGIIDRWSLGLYYGRLEEDTVTTGFGDFQTEYESENISLFGQGTHIFSDNTRLTLGLRVERYDLETEMSSRPDVDFDDWLFGGKLTLEHDANEENTLFASVTRGYKAGGANIYPFLAPTLPAAYDTEYLWNYEAGLRSTWFDNRVTTQLTFFYLDREDTQLRDSDGTGLTFTYFTTNGEGAAHYGAEAEASWYLHQDWTLNLSAGLLDTERDRYPDPGAPTSSIAARELSNAPNYTYSARLDYAPEKGLFASAEVIGSDDYYESNSHPEKRMAYTVTNAAIGYRTDQWTFTLWSKNLLDEKYEERVFFFPNGDPDFVTDVRYEAPAAPRTFGATVNFRW